MVIYFVDQKNKEKFWIYEIFYYLCSVKIITTHSTIWIGRSK